MKDEIDKLLNTMLSAAFRQGMANQRHEDALAEAAAATTEIQEEAAAVFGVVQEIYTMLNIPMEGETKKEPN